MKMIHMQHPQFPDATLEGYILDCNITLGQDVARPAIVVLPGGGYVYCSDAEAEPVALSYTASGFHAFILRYSVGRNAKDFAPLKQVDWVIGMLRENAKAWHIDPNKILVCGFSAGGHLALSSGVMGENKPNGMILGYPVASAPCWPGMDFMLKLLTGKETVTQADADVFDLIPKITKDAPPVFLMATAEDALTPYGSLAIAKRYSEVGLGYELHIFQYGPHGYSLANATSAMGSSQKLDASFAHWQKLSVDWIFKTYGQPVFEDKNTSRMAEKLKEMGIDLKGM